MNYFRVVIGGISMMIVCWNIWITISPNFQRYILPSYTEQTYKDLENAYNTSQYRRKNNPGIIPDETVFSYAAGAYAHGVDPILINSEHAPLGKYILAISILLLHNDAFPILLCGIAVLFAVWVLARSILNDPYIALAPVALLTTDVLFRNQFLTVPLLDIIQLPFILWALVAFIVEHKNGQMRYFWTALCVGLAMATKHPATGVLLIATYVSAIGFKKSSVGEIMRLGMWMFLGAIVYVSTYARTFMSGYTFGDFIGFQKWIILYQKSKFLYPFSSWRLLLFNQWQTWWDGNRIIAANDWSWLWPVSTLLVVGFAAWWMIRREVMPFALRVLTLWWGVYMIFLSTGVVSSRFFLPVLPVAYTLSVYVLILFFMRYTRIKLV